MLERQLKQWINTAYGGRCNFIEPAYGSSLGMTSGMVETYVARGNIEAEYSI